MRMEIWTSDNDNVLKLHRKIPFVIHHFCHTHTYCESSEILNMFSLLSYAFMNKYYLYY